MKTKQRRAQLIFILIGLLLFIGTYLYYPSINKNRFLEKHSIDEGFEKKYGLHIKLKNVLNINLNKSQHKTIPNMNYLCVILLIIEKNINIP